MEKIFIIEDDEKIRKEITTFLIRYGYECEYSSDFENITNIVLDSGSHLILLDINLPYYDGYYICREIRKKSNIPIIVVTSRQSEMDELMSMNLGADDFITKPYNTQILLAHIASVLKRTYQNVDNDVLSFNGLIFNMSTSSIRYNGEDMELTKNESKILNILMKKKQSIVSRNEIMDFLWQSDEFVDDNTLTVNINRLRRKLENLGAKDYIQTKRGQGYILQ
ncbi:response regulator transcription factor [Clostridium sp. SHJSY1]|uniref:response regulator transcription factor n=1 Tax=Clostridium sp. SHJSY1 TaxID=2942483 RepID=UPI0028753101|nr:response regulator transcription factor [Clostridium sp. SHJSY1]MDS0524461.1 response regulator transcription factor [Clostridium sp. SHJSY1]